jgi:hypothetical protein
MIDDTNLEKQGAAVGQYEETDDDLRIWRNCLNARSKLAGWRSEAREDFDFEAGRQWSELDTAKLTEQGRPVVTFNRTIRAINAVCGLQVQTRQEAACFPVEMSDSGTSEYQTNVLRYFKQRCDADSKESKAFRDAAVCGMGWVETALDIEDIDYPKLDLHRLNPLHMLWDPLAKDDGLADSRWVAHVKSLDRMAFKEMFPDEDFVAYDFWGIDGDTGQPHDATNDWKYANDQSDKMQPDQTCSVIQYQEWQKRNCYRAYGPNKQAVELSGSQFKKLKKQMDAGGIQYVQYQKKVYTQYFLIKGRTVQKKDLQCDQFTFNAITGYLDHNKNRWFGLVRLMKDPQRWSNKWMSQIQHIVNSGAKNGLIYETGALKNPRKAEAEWAIPGSMTEVVPGGLERVRDKVPPPYPDGVDRLLQYAMGAIEDVIGVNLELLGMANRDQAIGLEQERKQAGITMLATLFDSMRLYLKEQARLLMQYVQAYIPENTLVRITGEAGAQYVPLIKNKLSAQYDIIIDEAPTSPNMKESVSRSLMQVVPIAMNAGIPIPPDILDYTTLPVDLVQKWKRLIMSQQNDPSKQQMQQMRAMSAQLELYDKRAEIEKKGSEVAVNYGKVASEQAYANMQNPAIDAQIEHEKMMNEQQRKYIEMMLDQQRKDQEHRLAMEQRAQIPPPIQTVRQPNTAVAQQPGM